MIAMIYEIQHRIRTLAKNAVGLQAGFSLLDINFSHWEFTWSDGWKQGYWLASSNIETPSIDAAYKEFSGRMAKIIPKVALIGQCYVEYLAQPFLIHRIDSELALLKYVEHVKGVGLMFREKQLDGLKLLLTKPEIPEEFYYYWNDAVNTVGYSSKLLLMFSAIEALVKVRSGTKQGEKDWDKLERILGSELKAEIWGVIKNTSNALRHRLVHGEYFNPIDSGKDYVDLIHKRVICYFNDSIFGKKLLHEYIVNPQRTFEGNKQEWRSFIRSKSRKPFVLKEILSEVKTSDLDLLQNYDLVRDDALINGY